MWLLAAGDTSGAIEILQKLIQDNPDLPQPYNNLAAIYASEGEFEMARQLLIRLLEVSPRDPVGLENLGDLYVKMAFDTYQKIRELDPDRTPVSVKLQNLERLFQPAS